MNSDDFRYMRRGKQLSGLKEEDVGLLEPINKVGTNKDRALLLLHGFSSSPAVYRFFIPKIKNYDALVCPVLTGHAESIEAFSRSTAEDWRLAAYNACNSLMKEYKKVDVLGLSLGGLLACELSQHFKLNHLFLLAPALKIHLKISPMLTIINVLRALGFHHLRNAAGNLMTREHAELAYRKLPLTSISEMLKLAQNYQWVAPACPTDLFLGEHDGVVACKEVEQLFLSVANVNIHWLKNSAHVLPLDNDYEEILECINQTE